MSEQPDEVAVTVDDGNGRPLTMTLTRTATTADGEGVWSFRYRTGRWTVGGDNVLAGPEGGLWEVVRQALNHSEGEPEYCGECGTQYEPVGNSLWRRREGSYPLAERAADALLGDER